MRDSGASAERIGQLLAGIDTMSADLAALAPGAPAKPEPVAAAPTASVTEDPFETVRLDMKEMDAMFVTSLEDGWVPHG